MMAFEEEDTVSPMEDAVFEDAVFEEDAVSDEEAVSHELGLLA